MGGTDEPIKEAVARAQESTALVATSMAVFNIEDGGIVQAMAQAADIDR